LNGGVMMSFVALDESGVVENSSHRKIVPTGSSTD